MTRKSVKKFFSAPGYSAAAVLAATFVLLLSLYGVVRIFKPEVDVGGMVVLRQTDMGMDSLMTNGSRLSRSMILNYITSPEVIMPVAASCKWNVPYEQMAEAVDVKERLSTQNSYTIIVHTGKAELSGPIAKALAQRFLDYYRQKWSVAAEKHLKPSAELVTRMRAELDDLLNYRSVLRQRSDLKPLNTEIELQALNEQLLAAQEQFLTAYGAYISTIEAKRTEMQLEYDMACRLYTQDAPEIKIMRLKLKAMNRISAESREKFARQKPELYRMTLEPQKLTGLPNDVLYFYDNVQSLQQLKLALMIDSLIKDKEKMLEKEKQNIKVIERMLKNNTCDVSMREEAI